MHLNNKHFINQCYDLHPNINQKKILLLYVLYFKFLVIQQLEIYFYIARIYL